MGLFARNQNWEMLAAIYQQINTIQDWSNLQKYSNSKWDKDPYHGSANANSGHERSGLRPDPPFNNLIQVCQEQTDKQRFMKNWKIDKKKLQDYIRLLEFKERQKMNTR